MLCFYDCVLNPTVRLQIHLLLSYLSYVAGDGSGGNLAAAVALKLRDEKWTPALKMQVSHCLHCPHWAR